jgi:hypothetical protein
LTFRNDRVNSKSPFACHLAFQNFYLFIYLFFGSGEGGDPARDPVLLLSFCQMLPMAFKIF